jgi:hypothetical protein
MGDYVALKRLLVRTTPPGFRRGLITTRDRLLDLQARWREKIGWQGSLPNFIVVGTQKGGTTELYDQLIMHPQIAPAFAKEVHFFDANYGKGVEWYSTFFPRADSHGASGMITGEASPCYIFHPDVARRVAETLPNVKIILLLRNPVDRAYSHYHHEVRLGYETFPFECAIEREQMRLSGEKAKMLQEQNYYSDSYMHYSYLTRGIYVEQLQTWFEHFSKEQILVLKSEEFYKQMPLVMSQVYDFLGVPNLPPMKMNRHKSFPYPKMEQRMRQQLVEYFKPYNEQLYDYLGRDFCWS